LVLERESEVPLAYIDASYAVHNDFKSHSGMVITLGKGPLAVASSKQKIVTKSSTEAEIVALSDKMGDVLWFKEMLEEQERYKNKGKLVNKPVVIYQDNKSAIRLAEFGKSTSTNTKHINIRYFFVKDRLDAGEARIEYMCTTNMVADIMTKPLLGTPFRHIRSLLLNDNVTKPDSEAYDRPAGV